MGGGLGVEQNRAATKPSIYLAWRLPIVRERATPTRWAEAQPAQTQDLPRLTASPVFAKRATPLLFAAIRVGVFSALGFVLAKGNPRFAGFLVCVVLCFSQC